MKSFRVALARLETTRARPAGIANAERLMHEASAGRHPRREPILVRERLDGQYDVVDGNSTVAVARTFGWTEIFAITVTDRKEIDARDALEQNG